MVVSGIVIAVLGAVVILSGVVIVVMWSCVSVIVVEWVQGALAIAVLVESQCTFAVLWKVHGHVLGCRVEL